GGAGGSGSSSGAGGSGSADGGVDPPDSGPDQAVDRAPAPLPNGSACSAGTDCMSTHCFDKVCCDKDCSGTCMTCNAGTPGSRVPAASGTDRRDECPIEPLASCGTTGVCDGAGACRLYAANQICDSVAFCDSSGASVVGSRICNGAGSCVAGTSQSCGAQVCA